MSEETETDTSGATDSNTDSEATAMATAEAEAEFLENLAPDDYPSVLRVTSNPEETHRQNALARLERWEAGQEVPHVVNFQEPSDLRALLTNRRIELLRSIMADRPASIRQLAQRLGRDVKSVHENLQILADYDIVLFEEEGQAKRPVVPYETIEISLEISAPERSDDAAPA
jgi:predicted transcriptional regulator